MAKVIESVSPEELLHALSELHLRELSEGDVAILAARARGIPNKEIAAVLFLSTVTVRHRVDRLKDLICTPAGASLDLVVVGRWIELHASCCISGALSLAEVHDRSVANAAGSDKMSDEKSDNKSDKMPQTGADPKHKLDEAASHPKGRKP